MRPRLHTLFAVWSGCGLPNWTSTPEPPVQMSEQSGVEGWGAPGGNREGGERGGGGGRGGGDTGGTARLTNNTGRDKEASPSLIYGWGSPTLFLLAWLGPSFGTQDPERPAANPGTCQKAAGCQGQSSSAFFSHQLTPRRIPVWYVVSSCSATLI